MEEGNTIKLALALARQRGWRRILIQAIYEKLIKKPQRKDSNDSKCATIIQNILDLKALFSSCSFHHVKINRNIVASRLAKFALELIKVVLWENSFSVDLRDRTD